MEMIKGLLGDLWGVWTEMFGHVKELAPKAFHLIVWILLGILILPCVYVSAIFYPMWTEWGEKM